MHRVTLSLVLLALGDALLGRQLANSLGLERSAARSTAETLLTSSLAAEKG